MALAFPQFTKIKNRYCIAYFGPCLEYVLQLLYLRPAIEKELPGIEVYIACRADCKRLVENQPRIFLGNEVHENIRQIAVLREIRCDLKSHPILNLIEEAELTLRYLEYPQRKQLDNRRCVICPNSTLPTKPIPVEKVKAWVINRGYLPIISENVADASLVVGPENEQLFMAAMRGIPTVLVPTGLGTTLYKKMFPSGEICDLTCI